MKKFKSSFLTILALILTLSLLSACSNNQDSGQGMSQGNIHDSSNLSNESKEIADRDGNEISEEETGESPQEQEGEKVILTYFVNLETTDFEKSKEDLDSLIKDQKAFIEHSNISSTGHDNYRYGSFSIRIPKENIDIFKKALTKFGSITEENINKEDVTKFYSDTESRLKVVTSKEKRLLELLEKASKIEDIITIESELTDTIYEKEILEKELRSVDEKVEYASLQLELMEVRNLSNIDKSDSSLGLRLKNAFKDSTLGFKVAIENFIIWLVYALPYLIILIPLAVFLIIFIKRKYYS